MHKTFFCAALLLAATLNASAVVVTGVTATADGSYFGDINHIVDGSGLSSYDTSAMHASGDAQNAWTSGVIQEHILFDLHGVRNLTGMAVWNFNGFSGFGVKLVSVLGSLDGIHFSPIPGAPTQFAQGAHYAAETAELFSFTTTAAYIRFDTLSTFQNAAGLSEVMFTATSVPEPMSLALFGLGLAGLMGWRRWQASAVAQK
jgi:PEP-CTERM motif